MPKPPSRRGRPPTPRSTWVRKNMAMDQTKLTKAKRILGVATETEAVDAALDLIAFRSEVTEAIDKLAGMGPWEDHFR